MSAPHIIHHLIITTADLAVTTLRCAIQSAVPRGLGIWPEVITVSLCEAERDLLPNPGDLSQILNIDLRLGLDTGSIVVADWALIDAREVDHGMTDDNPFFRSVQWVWTLEDGRRRLQGRKGGMLFRGVLNRLRPNGAIIAPKQKNSDLVAACIGAIRTMTYREGLPLAGTLIASLDAFEPPVEIIWQGAHAPTELQHLLDWTRHALAFNQDGSYSIHRLVDPGQSLASPTFGEAKLPGGSVTLGNEAPAKCIISSAPTRNLIERKRTLTMPNPLVWVGVDVDGSIRPLTDLSWWPGGKTPIEVWTGKFKDVGDAYKNLARASVFRMLQLSNVDLTQRWTLASRLIDEQGDALERGIPLAVRLKAIYAQPNEFGMWVQSTTLVPVPDVRFDLERGVIVTNQPLVKLDSSDKPQNEIGAVALGAGDLELTFSHLPSAGDETDYYMAVFAWNGSAVVRVTAGSPVSDALNDGVPIYQFADLQVTYREKAHPSTDVDPINIGMVDALALLYAQSIISTGHPELRIEQYPMLHSVDPNGSIAMILWDGNALATTVHLGNFVQITSQYIRRVAMHRLSHGGSLGAPRGGGAVAGVARGASPAISSGSNAPSTGHRIATGQGVPALPSAQPVTFQPFFAQITGRTGPIGNKWSYTFAQVHKTNTGAGASQWTTGLFSGTAGNLFELINDATGVNYLGVGVTNNELDDTANSGACALDLRPVPDGVIVLMWPVPIYKADGSVVIEYWFQWTNGVYEEPV